MGPIPWFHACSATVNRLSTKSFIRSFPSIRGRLPSFPNAPLAHANPAQRADSPLAPLLDGETDVAVMAEDFFAFAEASFRLLFVVIVGGGWGTPCDGRRARPEAHAAFPLPAHVRRAAVVG